MAKNLTEKEIEIFEKMTVPRAVAALAVPTVISQLVTMIYNLADTWFIGQLNDAGMLAAVTVVFPFFLTITAFANLFGIGGASLLSRSLGAGNPRRAGEASATAVWLAFIVTGLFSIASFIWRVPILAALGAKSDTFSYASGYIFWAVTVGGIPTVGNVLLAHLVRAAGAPREASFGMCFGGVLNLLLDPFFIYDWGLGMKIEGAALATCISNFIALLYFLFYIYRSRSGPLTLSPRLFSPNRAVAGSIVYVGLPSSVIFFMSVVSNVVLNYLMSSYTSIALAAVGVVKKVDMMPNAIVHGICGGVIPLMAYSFAKKDFSRLRESTRFAALCAIAVTLFFFVTCEFFAPYVIEIFTGEPGTIERGASFLRLHCASIPFHAVFYLVISYFQAIGRGTPALILSFLRKGPIDIPFMIALNLVWPMYGIMAVQPIMDLIVAVICICVFFKLGVKYCRA